MKFSKIAALAKREKTAILMRDADGVQWLGTGSAAYMLGGMPPLDTDTVLTVMGVPEDKKSTWFSVEKEDRGKLLENDVPGEEEVTADNAGISVIYGGKLLMPIYTMMGMVWIDVELLAPTDRKEEGYRRFFIREMENGIRAVAVKEGLVLTAVIMECRIESNDLADALDTLAGRYRLQKTMEERKENDIQGTIGEI
ncbi:MAG: hypothetical protein HFE61_08400 [Anaerotignum sp.]|jgi:hypothetical protein|nr:hypothetical protein [Anaerotignum sp.]